MAVCTCYPVLGRQEQEILGARWPDVLVYSVSFRFSEQLCLQKYVAKQKKITTTNVQFSLCIHIHVHLLQECTHPHRCTHTYIPYTYHASTSSTRCTYYTPIHTHTHALHTQTHTCAPSTRMHTPTYLYTHIYYCEPPQEHTHFYTHIHTYKCTHLYTHTHTLE